MKPDNLTKLYEGMTIRERSSLAFHYIVEKNRAEIERIAGSVPVCRYRGIDYEFGRGVDRIMTMVMCCAIDRWRLEAMRFAAIGLMHVDGHLMEGYDALQGAESKLLALDEVLNAVCEELGISPDDARSIAGSSCDIDTISQVADTEYRDKMLAELMELAIG